MDLLTTVLTSLAGGLAHQAGTTLYPRVVALLRGWGKEQTDARLLQALRDLGSLSDDGVRKRVAEFAREARLSDDQRGELTTLLLKLVHGSRFHTTHGGPSAGYLKCKDLLEQLLARLLPLKRAGSPVAAGLPDWKLVRFLGMGTFGEVWLAENEHFHPRERAIKFFTLPDGERWLAGEQYSLLHIRKELKDHPNIVTFLDVAFRSKPHPYLALEYVAGGSLEDWLLRPPGERAPLNKPEVLRGIVRGLARAHSKGIVHRDLKPGNILLHEDLTAKSPKAPRPEERIEGRGSRVEDRGREPPPPLDPRPSILHPRPSSGLGAPGDLAVRTFLPKITDFGLGQVRGAAGGPAPVEGGTTLYLPPEALEPFRERDPAQDDVFAVGVIWYQLLTERVQRPPYDFASELRERGVDSHTLRLIERCLAQPGRRFADACELESALEAGVPETWEVPAGCFDVGELAREYLAGQTR